MKTEYSIKFNGPVFTVFTAFDDQYNLDISATLKYVDFLLEHEVKHLYVMPYNSRYLQLNRDEILLLNKSVIKHTKVNSTAKIIVSGPVECSTDDTLIFCDHAFEAGTDCFASAFGEKYFSDDQIIRHYDLLSNKYKSILVHEQPLISGYDSRQINWPLPLVEKVALLDGIIGFK